jgi:hypothetical protein
VAIIVVPRGGPEVERAADIDGKNVEIIERETIP